MKFVTDAPERAVVLLLCLVISVGPLTAFEQFRPFLVLPLFLVLAALTWRVLPRSEVSRESFVGSVLALLVAGGWVVFNAPYFSEFLIIVRDPAIYTTRALWLMHHASPVIDVSAGAKTVNGVPGAIASSGGFPLVGHELQPQGDSLVPALVAVFGWLGGTRALLAGNLVIGAVALLAVYALGRRIVGPIWALAPMIALSISMPMVAFSRAPYTEPTALALAVGGTLFLWYAIENRHGWLGFLAGLALGATILARIDGLRIVVGAIAGLGAATLLSVERSTRHQLRRLLLMALGGASIPVALGYVDLTRNSSVYKHAQWSELKPLTIVAGGFCLLVVALSFLPLDGLRRWARPRRQVLARAVAACIGIAFGAMLLRPFYWVGHGTDGVIATSLANRQRSLGLAVDGTRTYDEHTITWLSWYFSWPVVLLGVAGVFTVIAWMARRHDARLATVLGVAGASSLLYLNRSNITPDQIWAMRRYLPVVIPFGLIFAATIPLVLQRRWPKRAWLAALVAGVIAFAPILTWRRTLITPEMKGARALVDRICQQVAGGNIVLSDNGVGASIFLAPLRVECNTNVVMAAAPTPAHLAALRANFGDGKKIVVVTFAPKGAPWRTEPDGPTFGASYKIWNQPLESRPMNIGVVNRPVWIGDLGDDGLVAPRPAAG